ncbi:MAG: alpha/beta fold hydrolase [Pseudomonadota bacterium]
MRIILLSLVFSCVASGLLACGSNSDCPVGERFYRIFLPEAGSAADPMPALVFAHGFRGTARGVMRNPKLRALASDLGAALIAVKSVGPGWDLPNGPRTLNSDGSSEFAYFDAVLEDATSRFPIDRNRIVVTGFSAGGMMVWNLACARPDRFAGFVPIAGTFWLKPPETCARPVASIIHIHGDQDKTVPLLGRQIGPTKQGEVPAALDMYATFGSFARPERRSYEGLSCKERRTGGGDVLDFCLFSGGHRFDPAHLRHGWERLEAAGRL